MSGDLSVGEMVFDMQGRPCGVVTCADDDVFLARQHLELTVDASRFDGSTLRRFGGGKINAGRVKEIIGPYVVVETGGEP